MFPLALVAALLSAPVDAPRGPVAVVITSKRPGADAFASKVAARVYDSLKREGVAAPLDEATAARELKAAGFSDPRSCDGSVSCLVKLAVLLGPRAVIVGVDVGKVAKSLALHLEAVTADGEVSLHAVDLLAPVDAWQDKTAADLARFSRKVKDALVPVAVTPPVSAPVAVVEPAAKKPVDAPVAPVLEPKPVEEPPAQVLQESVASPPAPVLPWVAAGGSVVALGGAGVLAALGLADKGAWEKAQVQLPDGSLGTTLTRDQSNALAGSANAKLTGAVLSGVVGVGLGVAAGVLFAGNAK